MVDANCQLQGELFATLGPAIFAALGGQNDAGHIERGQGHQPRQQGKWWWVGCRATGGLKPQIDADPDRDKGGKHQCKAWMPEPVANLCKYQI